MSGDIDVSIVPPTISSSDGKKEGGIARLDSLWEGRIEAKNYPHIEIHVNVETSSGSVGDGVDDRFSIREADDRQEIESITSLTSSLDLVFVFDDTGSMSGEINAAKRRVTNLTTSIEERGIDARYGLVTFKDSTEIDTHLTDDADTLKEQVDKLEASGGGDAPESNFDAIETALSLDFRSDANQVFVDITDAPSHYRNDGSGYAEHTIDEVADDLQASNVTFIAVSPGYDDEQASVQVLANKVNGLWTNIHGTDFDRVLDRITSLLVSTYVLTYHTCTPPGVRREVQVTYEDPGLGSASDSATLHVPERFELPPECAEKTDVGETELSTRVSRDLPARGGETVLEAEIDPGRSSASLPQHIILGIDASTINGDGNWMREVLAGVETVRSELGPRDRLGLLTFDGTNVEADSLGDPGELAVDVHESMLENPGGEPESQLSRGIDTARRQLRGMVRGEQTIDRIVLLTDGHGLRDTDDSAQEYRQFAREIATDNISITVGALGTDPNLETIVALTEGSGGTVERIQNSSGIDDFLRETIEAASNVVVPNPRLRIEPTTGFTTLTSVDRDESVYCRMDNNETLRRFVPPVSEVDSATIVHLPNLQEGQTQRILVPMLGSRKATGMSYRLADTSIVEKDGGIVASSTADVTYVSEPEGAVTYPEAEKRLTDSKVNASLTEHDFEKARAQAKTLKGDDEKLKEQLLKRVDDAEESGGSLSIYGGKRRITDE